MDPASTPIPVGPAIYAVSLTPTALTFWAGVRHPVAALTVLLDDIEQVDEGRPSERNGDHP